MNTDPRARGSRSLADIIIEIPGEGSETNNSTIFAVPPILRKVDQDAFNPKIVALGPYHRRDQHHLREMEELKPRCLRRLLGSTADLRATLNSWKRELEKLDEKTRSCYSDPIDMVPAKLTEMLLLDGCFILEALKDPNSVADRPWKYACVAMDMVMLENQIPFHILEKLLELVGVGYSKLTIDQLIRRFAEDYLSGASSTSSTSSDAEKPFHLAEKAFRLAEKPFHLLHGIRSLMVPSNPAGSNSILPSNNERHLWKPLTARLGSPHRGVEAEKDVKKESIHGAVALREAGVKIEINGSASLEVSFENRVLKMSPIVMYDQYRFLFRNLVALEQCCRGSSSYITDYVVFLSRLMSSPRDVALLHEKGVLVNGIGSEEEVAQLVTSLARNLVWDPKRNELKHVFQGINRHYKKRVWKWKAALQGDYFGSPWSIISLAAATLLLILTSLQTSYTVLGYYKNGD